MQNAHLGRAYAAKNQAITVGSGTRVPIMNRQEIQGDRDFAGDYMEITGSSTLSVEDAVAKAIRRAYQTSKPLTGFQWVDTRASIDNGREQAWQVTLKVGCSMTTETRV